MNEIFSFSSAWDVSRSRSSIVEYHNVLWFPKGCPKFSCCLLRDLHERLPTRQRLVNFGIISTNNCVLCNVSHETIEHLFFNCAFSSYIWKLATETRSTTKLDGQLIKAKFSHKANTFMLAKHAIGAAVWHIWHGRNRKIFKVNTCIKSKYSEDYMRTSIS